MNHGNVPALSHVSIWPLALVISIAKQTIELFPQGGPNGIYTVGTIPKGLPGYTGNKFFPFVGGIGQTFGLSIVVCLIDLTESISIARALALKNRCGIMPAVTASLIARWAGLLQSRCTPWAALELSCASCLANRCTSVTWKANASTPLLTPPQRCL